MDPRSLQAIFDDLGLGQLTPPGTPGATLVPPNGFQQPAPFDTSVRPGTSFGAPYPGAVPISGAPPPAVAPTTPVATGTPAAGYTPQPRPELARPLLKGPGSDLFAGYRDVYNPAPEDQDPLAALLGTPPSGPGFPPQAPPSRALTVPWAGEPGQPQYGAGGAQIDRQAQHVMPTESEKALLRGSPAYARAINRIRALDQLRRQKGMM